MIGVPISQLVGPGIMRSKTLVHPIFHSGGSGSFVIRRKRCSTTRRRRLIGANRPLQRNGRLVIANTQRWDVYPVAGDKIAKYLPDDPTVIARLFFRKVVLSR